MYQNFEYILTKNSELLYRDQFCQSSFTKYYSRYLELTRITFGIIDALYLEELIEACAPVLHIILLLFYRSRKYLLIS